MFDFLNKSLTVQCDDDDAGENNCQPRSGGCVLQGSGLAREKEPNSEGVQLLNNVVHTALDHCEEGVARQGVLEGGCRQVIVVAYLTILNSV